jgi:thiamine pyrophosphate-dependent acetolactate synthase large subunit-like protein
MELHRAVGVLHGARKDAVVIPTMGVVHPWQALSPHALDFVYLPSSMGQAVGLGLGLALAQPDRRVVVCTGDGSLLMNLGSLVTVAEARPSNLTVLCFDNGIYEVTGGQPRPGQGLVDFAAIARGCGIARVCAYDHLESWLADAAAVVHAPGPVFVWLEVEPAVDAASARSPGPVGERLTRFRRALGTTHPRAGG